MGVVAVTSPARESPSAPPNVSAVPVPIDDGALLWPEGATPVVAFQGERGAYGDLAIEVVWGEQAFPLACWDFEGVVAAVRRGTAHFGVLPLDNSAIGEIAGVRA